MSERQQRPKGKLCEGLNKVDTHVDQHERATAFLGEPTLPDALLCHTQAAAVDFLERCVRDSVPLTALAGDSGTGKTTALNAALARRDSAGDRIIRAHNFVAGPLSLHRALTGALGVTDARELSADRLEPALRRALADAGHAAPPVLAVDNAQALLPETLRYLSLLAGLREAGQPLFRILLVGRSGFTARQPMPVQFTLEPIQPHAALRVVERRLSVVGMTLDDETVQGIVHDSRGNLRRLNTLLRARIEEAQASSRRPLRLAGSRLAMRARRLLERGQPRWRDTLVAASALLAISGICGFISYQGTTPRGASQHSVKAAALAAKPEARAPVPALPAAAIQVLPAPKLPPPKPPTVQPPAPHPVERLALAEPAPVKPPPPIPFVPEPPAPAAESIAVPASNDPPLPVPPIATPPQLGRFKVNNISGCHRGVCPRWAVTDLNRQAHLVAAFDPSPLHLDHDTMQRLRQGTLELTVSGSIKKRGQEGQTLVAETLQSMAPHRGRPRPPPSDATDPASSEDRSPPPGFLVAPAAPNPAPGQDADPEQ